MRRHLDEEGAFPVTLALPTSSSTAKIVLNYSGAGECLTLSINGMPLRLIPDADDTDMSDNECK